MLESQCHCGNVQIKVEKKPETLTSCNCSICYRTGALWGYFQSPQVQITTDVETHTYRWGDEYIDFHHCPNCGCTTHYTSTGKGDPERIAVNFRIFPQASVEGVQVRRFDGADSWTFLED